MRHVMKNTSNEIMHNKNTYEFVSNSPTTRIFKRWKRAICCYGTSICSVCNICVALQERYVKNNEQQFSKDFVFFLFSHMNIVIE